MENENELQNVSEKRPSRRQRRARAKVEEGAWQTKPATKEEAVEKENVTAVSEPAAASEEPSLDDIIVETPEESVSKPLDPEPKPKPQRWQRPIRPMKRRKATGPQRGVAKKFR